jgi:hypothetical protein
MDIFNALHFFAFFIQITAFIVGAYNILRGDRSFYPLMLVGAVMAIFESWAMLQ